MKKTLGIHGSYATDVVIINKATYMDDEFVIGVELYRLSGASFTGYASKSGELLTLRMRSSWGGINAATAPSGVYTVLHYDSVQHIQDAGAQRMDKIRNQTNTFYFYFKQFTIVYTMGCDLSICWDRGHSDRLERLEQMIQHYAEIYELWVTNSKQDCCAFVNSTNKNNINGRPAFAPPCEMAVFILTLQFLLHKIAVLGNAQNALCFV